jgi:hypothetical protein
MLCHTVSVRGLGLMLSEVAAAAQSLRLSSGKAGRIATAEDKDGCANKIMREARSITSAKYQNTIKCQAALSALQWS